MTWLTRTPIALVRACLTMLPRLESEEALDAMWSTAAGVGRLSGDEARRVFDTLMRTAGRTPSRKGDARARAEMPSRVTGMGLGWHVEPGAARV